ncbi:MAG TPA: hypothetical protein VJ485_04840 [archaeon]|nr:hypothetical protein [archaeon]
MVILKLPAKSYLESVDRAERAFMQVGMFRHFNIERGEGCIYLDIEEDFADFAKDVERIYHSYESPSA